MKKTIAILLILVIGMVGVFAADAKIHLETVVDEVTLMEITETSGPTWGFAEGAIVSSYTDDADGERKVIESDNTGLQIVGYVHAKTNRRGGIVINISSTDLSSTIEVGVDDVTQTIAYDIYKNSTGGAIYSSEGDPVAFLEIESGTGMRSIVNQEVSIHLKNTGEELSAGTYTGDITFELVTI